MTVVCDTSALVAYFDRSDAHWGEVTRALEADPGPFVVSAFVLAETDYLISTRRGVRAELAVLDQLFGGAWDLPSSDESDLRRAREIIARYEDHDIGLTDAMTVVVAGGYRTDRVATLDHRHFRVLRSVAGRRFTIIP